MSGEKTNENGCPFGMVLENRVSTLERERSEDREILHEIRDKLLGRPSWVICIIITILTSIALLSLRAMFSMWLMKGGP